MVPLERMEERLVLPFDRAGFARDALDSTVAYVGVEHAPPGAARTKRGDDGSIALETRLAGRVSDVGTTGFVVERDGLHARIRHLLPGALGLGALSGALVALEVSERLHAGRCTVDARLRDEAGRLVLWAHDGELPRVAHGLALRMRMAEGGRGLAIAHRGGLSIPRGPSVASVESDQGPLTFLVLRTGDDDVAFVAFTG